MCRGSKIVVIKIVFKTPRQKKNHPFHCFCYHYYRVAKLLFSDRQCITVYDTSCTFIIEPIDPVQRPLSSERNNFVIHTQMETIIEYTKMQ